MALLFIAQNFLRDTGNIIKKNVKILENQLTNCKK